MPLTGREPKEGDLIELNYSLYQHWGIYVGKGMIVHLTGENCLFSFVSAFGVPAVVKKESLERVADGCYYKVNNKDDKKRIPFPPTKIVRAALEQVGKKMNYSLTSANCEHFVTELRYGVGFSDQVDDGKKDNFGGFILAAAVMFAITLRLFR